MRSCIVTLNNSFNNPFYSVILQVHFMVKIVNCRGLPNKYTVREDMDKKKVFFIGDLTTKEEG